MNASNRWIMCRGDGFLREAHSYEYDNNGNILYVNTSSLSYCRKIHLSINQQVNMGLQVEHFITLAILKLIIHKIFFAISIILIIEYMIGMISKKLIL